MPYCLFKPYFMNCNKNIQYFKDISEISPMVKYVLSLLVVWGYCAGNVAAEPLKISAPTTAQASELVQKPASANLDMEHLSLGRAEAFFHEGNRDLKLAQQALEGAKADAIAAGQRPNPTLMISQYALNGVNWHSSGRWEQKIYDTIINMNQVIERGNKLGLRKEAAQLNINATREDLEDVLRTLRIVLYGAYYDLLLAQEKERITTETSTLYQKTLDATQRRLKAGDVSPSDVDRIRVDALRSQNDMRQAVADREKSQMNLAYLLGVESRAKEIHASDPWPGPLPVSMENPESLLEQRADVRAAKTRVAAAEKNRALAYALRTRDISVGVQVEHFPNQPNNNTVGFDVSFPIFINSYFEGQIARANSDWLAAEKNLERIKALALQEISKTQTDLASAGERYTRFSGELLKAAQKAASAAEFAYQHGAMGVLDLLDARRTLYATRLEAANTTADYAKSLAAWQIFIEPKVNVQ